MDFKKVAKQVTDQYIADKQLQANSVKLFKHIKSDTYYECNDTREQEYRKSKSYLPEKIISYSAPESSLLTLKQLRENINLEKPSIGVEKTAIDTKPRDESSIPQIQKDSRMHSPEEIDTECFEVSTCEDKLLLKVPFFFFDQYIERFTADQLESLSYWQKNIKDDCKLQNDAIVDQLEASHSFTSRLDQLNPLNKNAGLLDIRKSYSDENGGMMKHLLGETNGENTIRFTLPFELKQLENMNPIDYLMNYGIVSDTRVSYYTRIFNKYKDSRSQFISLSDMKGPLNALMGGLLKGPQIEELISLISNEDGEHNIDINEFTKICALAERLFCCQNRQIFGERQSTQRRFLEKADFHLILKKLEDVKLTDKLQKFFQRLDLFE